MTAENTVLMIHIDIATTYNTLPRKDQIRSVSWLIILHLNFLQTSQSRQLLWHCHASEGQMVDLYFCLKLFSHSREYNIHQNLAN